MEQACLSEIQKCDIIETIDQSKDGTDERKSNSLRISKGFS